MKKIFGKNLDPEESKRLEKLIHTGYEGYSNTTEAEVVKNIELYLKEQERLKKK